MSRYRWRQLAKKGYQRLIELNAAKDPRRATMLRLLYQLRMGYRIPDVWEKITRLLAETERFRFGTHGHVVLRKEPGVHK